jgi:7-cyano-7-deazaguanine synthase in queuosine biosynthesis
MRRYAVVVNDCATPGVPAIRQIRSRDTAHGQRNFTLRIDELVAGLPAQLDARQQDWIELLGHLFAIDMACERGHGDVDWSRSIQAWVPVRDPGYWEAYRVELEGIWTDLTDDELRLHFETETAPVPPPRQSRNPFPAHDCIALVSGGQDSFAGVLDLLDAGRKPLMLSHSASGAVNHAQNAVEAIVRGIDPSIPRLKLGALKTPGRDFPGAESSQRSRTLMFVGVAALVAALGGSREVMLNENGIMAVHVPLTAARVGSLSTHTASPPIVARMAALATAALATPVAVTNRLLRLTKPEVVGRAVALGHGADMAQTVSCWQIGRTHRHCGICAPCLLRRISCEHHSVTDVPYDHDVFDDPAALGDEKARDNLTHFISLVQDLAELDDVSMEIEYPELINGAPALTLAQTIDLHRRWAHEACAVLFAHPVPVSLR